jgi:hypothetical protein
MNEAELTELFRKLGAAGPEAWAHSQINGILQLPRYLFLREAWRRVVTPNDRGWIGEMRTSKDPNEAGGEFGPAIERLLAAGARPDDLTTIVRIMQWRLLFDICVLLDDPGIEDEIEDLWWALFLVDENGKPTESVNALHGVGPRNRSDRYGNAPA